MDEFGNDGTERPAESSVGTDLKVPEPRRMLVERWSKRMAQAEKRWEKAFKRMDTCIQIAANGTDDKDWLRQKKFVVPILTRHINQVVSRLYARNPTASVKRKSKMLYQIWDGDPQSFALAQQAAAGGDETALAMVQALAQDIAKGQQYTQLVDRIAQTMEILWEHYADEQSQGFKKQMKALVRRTKVTGVGFVKLGFKRALKHTPEVEEQMEDITTKIEATQRLLDENAAGEIAPDSADLEQLRLNLQALQAQQDLIVNEGPIFTFPKSKRVLIDPQCEHLKTLAGARWIAEPYDFTPEKVKEIYGVDLGENFTKRREADRTSTKQKSKDTTETHARIWHVQDKENRQTFVIAEGHPDFIREPADPDVQIERFFDIFPLVFNEVEPDMDEDDDGFGVYPASDVWMARHNQDEYNRSREGLREHRVANRPFYVVASGSQLSDSDRDQISNHAAHQVIELKGLKPDADVAKLLQRGPVVPIDPNQYEVGQHFQDIQRTIGSSQAELGTTSGDTATEAAIAEDSRESSSSDNVDDLDELLSDVAGSTGQLMLLELDKQTVMTIAGPGAAWPDVPQTRQEIAQDLLLEIEAGSSGRPNRAADLADLERAAPFVIQLPGFNPNVLVKRYARLLDFPIEEALAPQLPSITALNSLAGRPAAAQPGTGDPQSDPAQQGGEGGNNQQQPDQTAGAPQPAFPAATDPGLTVR